VVGLKIDIGHWQIKMTQAHMLEEIPAGTDVMLWPVQGNSLAPLPDDPAVVFIAGPQALRQRPGRLFLITGRRLNPKVFNFSFAADDSVGNAWLNKQEFIGVERYQGIGHHKVQPAAYQEKGFLGLTVEMQPRILPGVQAGGVAQSQSGMNVAERGVNQVTSAALKTVLLMLVSFKYHGRFSSC
jgi:hypothetical protein